jgi:hypothetical protein
MGHAGCPGPGLKEGFPMAKTIEVLRSGLTVGHVGIGDS